MFYYPGQVSFSSNLPQAEQRSRFVPLAETPLTFAAANQQQASDPENA